MKPSEDILARAIRIAQAGIDYTPRHGAICPCCGTKKLPITRTMKWEGATRTRYHRCRTPSCTIAKLEIGIKSIESDHASIFVPKSRLQKN